MRRLLLTLTLTIAVSTLGFGQAKPKIVKGPAPVTSAANGAEMFTQYCAVCHGPEGKGTGPAAPALKVRPADLSQLAKNNGGKYPELKVVNFVMGDEVVAAHGSRDMPIWGDVFRSMHNDDATLKLRAHNLSTYVQTLQEK